LSWQAQPYEGAAKSLLTLCWSNALTFNVHGLQQGFVGDIVIVE